MLHQLTRHLKAYDSSPGILHVTQPLTYTQVFICNTSQTLCFSKQNKKQKAFLGLDTCIVPTMFVSSCLFKPVILQNLNSFSPITVLMNIHYSISFFGHEVVNMTMPETQKSLTIHHSKYFRATIWLPIPFLQQGLILCQKSR